MLPWKLKEFIGQAQSSLPAIFTSRKKCIVTKVLSCSYNILNP